MYESPAMDTDDGLMGSVYIENKSKKDEFIVEESNTGQAENFGKFKRSGIGNEKVVGDVQSSGLQNCNDSCGENKQKKLPSMKVTHHSFLFVSFFHDDC